MDLAELGKLLAALGIGGAITKVVDEWRLGRKARREAALEDARYERERQERLAQVEKMALGYEDISSLMRVLKDLRVVSGATRVIVWCSENSGGMPRPGAPVKITALYEERSDLVPPLQAAWNRREVQDPGYMDILAKLTREGHLKCAVKDMPAGDGMRVQLSADGTVVARKWRICATRTQLIYLSLHMDTDEPQSDTMIVQYQAAVAQLRAMFQRHYDLIELEHIPSANEAAVQ